MTPEDERGASPATRLVGGASPLRVADGAHRPDETGKTAQMRARTISANLGIMEDSTLKSPATTGTPAPARTIQAKIVRALASLSVVAVSVIGSLGVVSLETACSSVCSSDEEAACTNTFQACIAQAASSADLNKCQSCADAYCKCFDDCGSTCDRDRVSGTCAGGGGG